MTKLTEKQVRALRATADPGSILGYMFWADARASWAGPRKTLGSLLVRGLVDYDEGWSITAEGEALLKEMGYE